MGTKPTLFHSNKHLLCLYMPLYDYSDERNYRLERLRWTTRNCPELDFRGDVIFVRNYEEDEKASEEIEDYGAVGFDCEWEPDTRRESSALATVQICTGNRCYIWLMWHFYENGNTPQGLYRILDDEDILKAGCGLANDFRKLALSGLNVCDTTIKRGKVKYIRPSHFYELQKRQDKRGDDFPFDALSDLTRYWVRHRLPSQLDPRYIEWQDAERDSDVEQYIVHDAYAALLVFLFQTDQLDNADRYLQRDYNESSSW